MRRTFTLAAALAAGLAAAPAHASSFTALFDFTIADVFGDGVVPPESEFDVPPAVGQVRAGSFTVDLSAPLDGDGFFQTGTFTFDGVPARYGVDGSIDAFGDRIFAGSGYTAADGREFGTSFLVESWTYVDPDRFTLTEDDIIGFLSTVPSSFEARFFSTTADEPFASLFVEGTFSNVRAAPPEVIPLPAAGWLMIAGLGGLMALRRRA
jgi:hypothetical protein